MIYNLIGVSEGIKTNTLIKQTHLKNVLFVTTSIFRQNFFFLIKFQSSVSNGWHDVLMMSIDINSIVILDIHFVDYCNIIVGSEAIDLIKKFWFE